MAHNDTTIINIDSTETAVKMFDKFSRIKAGRRIQPLDITQNVDYLHRSLYNEYNLQIGDTCFMIPPEFIMVNSEATSQSIVMLRQENTQKQKSGHHRRTILIDLVFNGTQQLNGYPVNGPEGIYYVDGLRQLLAQFKCAPFLPIVNETINGTYAIFTVALQSITMSTLDGFPGAMTAQVTLQEINLTPYIEIPDVTFRYMIDWDLFRFYYQRFLTEDHEYRKLQSLPYNREYNRFKISILDSMVFESDKASKKNFLNVITDKDIARTDENGELCDSNYVIYLDSETSDVAISSFQCGYSNLLTNIQLADMRSPTIQYLGGMDTIYNITFETTDYNVVMALERCQIENDTLTRNNVKLRSVGFVKLESELVEFTGSLFVAIESVTTNTVPGFPGLFNVQMNCVSYDIGQSEREQLKGFMPFEDAAGEHHCIDQNWKGLKEKVRQDNYAEWKIRTQMEVYPDLHLPTYAEVNAFINKCIAFRRDNKLPDLPYSKYPTNPIAMLHGNKATELTVAGDLLHPSDMSELFYEYDIYVDPDFYVFYPSSYESFMKEDPDYYGISPTQRSSFSKTIVEEGEPDYSGTGVGGSSNLAEQFVQACRSMIGHQYVWGAAGPTTFDCSGLVTWALKKIGVMDSGAGRFTVSTIASSSLFEEVPYSQRQRGDVICNNDLSHVVVCQGDGTVVHASNSAPYPQGGVKESNEYFEGRVFRPKAFINDASSGGAHQASGSSAEEEAWNLLKSYGMTDIAAAGIMGNFGRETGGTYDPRIVQGGSHSDTPISGKGYGLPQYTYGPYQKGLVTWCNQNNVGCNTAAGQIGYMMSLISGTNWYAQMNSTQSVEEATRLFEANFEKAGVKAMDERIAYANGVYEKYKGTGGGSTAEVSKYNLTEDEFNTICKYVYQETLGEPVEAAKAVAQYIYDTITDTGVGLGAVLSTSRFPKGPSNGPASTEVHNAVLEVFKDGKRIYPNKIKDFIDTSTASSATFKNRDAKFPYSFTKGSHTFWCDKTLSSSQKYTIGASTNGSSTSGGSTVSEVTYDAITLDNNNLQYFAEPVLARVSKMKYGIYDTDGSGWHWENVGLGDTEGKENQWFSKHELNDGVNIFNTSFCNMYNYSGRGRLVRAFPAYLFCILDEDTQWYDGRKLWTNYYTHKSAVDIAVHETNDMATATATITISNSYHNLDVTQAGLAKYKITNDTEYFGNGGAITNLKKMWYDFTGLVPSFTGPKVTSLLMELHSQIYENAKLREGARVHLRMGYGSDPMGLAPMINGNLSDVTLGDQITMVITSDGNELIHHLTSTKQSGKDTNNGFLGLFGLGESQEASDIIGKVMTKRQSWMSKLNDNWFEGSMYGIEHFGLYINQSGWQVDSPDTGVPVIQQILDAGAGIVNFVGNVAGNINQLWAGQKEQYDILKNVYTSAYDRVHYVTSDWIFDGEENVVFNQFNMTPWDVFQVCTQQAPEYILKSSYHQFDSRLYFGIPMWMEKYRYDLFGATEKSESKIVNSSSNGNGTFNDNANEYDSGVQSPGVSGGDMTGFTLNVKMASTHSNPSSTDPDKVTLILFKGNKSETIEVFTGNLKGSQHTWEFDANQLKGVTDIQVKVHTPPSHKNCCKTADINWSFTFGGTQDDIAEGGDLFDECRASTQCHFIDSISCIIDNQVRVTGKFTNTNIKVMYVRGSEAMPTKLIQSDSTIDNAYQKTSIIDSPVVQDALGPDAFYEWLGIYKVGYKSAKRVGISNLLYGWQQEYQGQLLLLGEPGIRAHDYIMVNDSYANMYGVSVVREVIHSFNTNTGFTTSITPGLIGFSTTQESGLIVACQNMLMILNMFSAFILARRQLIRNYEHCINLYANFEVLREQFLSSVKRLSDVERNHFIANTINHTGTIAATINLIRVAKDTKAIIKGAQAFAKAYKGVKTIGAGIKATFTAISAGIKGFSSALGPGAILVWAGMFVIDKLVDAFFEWLENKNVVCLLPMWWEDYPFVYNTKDGKKILLIDSNADATDEGRSDPRAESVDPNGEFEEG